MAQMGGYFRKLFARHDPVQLFHGFPADIINRLRHCGKLGQANFGNFSVIKT